MPRRNRVRREFHDWFEDERRRRGLNYSEMAKLIDVDPSMVSRWMHAYAVPTAETLGHIAQALGADEAVLLRMAGHLGAAGDDDPEVANLKAKLGLIRWTPDRMKIVEALLEDLRQRSQI